MPNTQVTTATTHSSTTPPINGNKAMMWYGIAVLAIIIDQLTKLYFEHNYQLYQTTAIIEPIFNMADVAINIGVALILIDAFLLESKRNTL